MNCVSCGQEFDDNEVDTDKLCFICSTGDTVESPDYLELMKMTLGKVIADLASAKNTSIDEIKRDFINASEISKASTKKKVNSGNN